MDKKKINYWTFFVPQWDKDPVLSLQRLGLWSWGRWGEPGGHQVIGTLSEERERRLRGGVQGCCAKLKGRPKAKVNLQRRFRHCGLRIWHCCSCALSRDYSWDLIPGPGIPYAVGQPKMEKKKNAFLFLKSSTCDFFPSHVNPFIQKKKEKKASNLNCI